MSYDDHHVMNFWGSSPAFDVKNLLEECDTGAGKDGTLTTLLVVKALHVEHMSLIPRVESAWCFDCLKSHHIPFKPLVSIDSTCAPYVVGAGDVRHIFTTLARSRRTNPDQNLHFYVHEVRAQRVCNRPCATNKRTLAPKPP